MSIPVTSAPKRASGIAVVPSPQPRSKARSGGVIPMRIHECFSRFTHEGGNLCKVAFFPQRFVWIHEDCPPESWCVAGLYHIQICCSTATTPSVARVFT